jgi:hypothetical protein
MTKTAILAEITAFYTDVGTPTLIDTVGNSNYYIINVFETGLSAKNKKPTGSRKNIHFYVYKEGVGGQEAAYYDRDELSNDSNTDITGDNSLYAINKIYVSTVMRSRVQAAVAKAAQDVLNEAMPSSNMTADASSGQKNITVASGGSFYVGKIIVVSDTGHSESATIASIDSNVLTMTNNLTNSYTISNSGKVTFSDNKERAKWAGNAMIDPDNYTLAMTNFVALNPTVEAAGGQATDNDIQYVVNSYITKLAVALGFNL